MALDGARHPYVIVAAQLVFVILFGVFAEYSVTGYGDEPQDTPPGKLLRMYSSEYRRNARRFE